MKKYLILTSMFILVFYVMLVNSPITIENNDIEEKTKQSADFEHKNHIKLSIERPPIIIKGNDEFNETNGISSGTGSKENPFIIKNITIDALGSPYCICINDTNAYFEIQNCTFLNTGAIPGQSTILFGNVSNGFVFNNSISLAPIKLFNSNNNSISNNTIYKNSYISLSFSHNNSIFNNTLKKNQGNGILLFFSNNTKIIENTIINCSDGIKLVNSSQNKLLGNYIYNCELGICIWSNSDNNDIIGNRIYYNVLGIEIEIERGCDGNNESGNTCVKLGNGNPPIGPGPPPITDDDDDDDDDRDIEEIFLIPAILSIIGAALVSTIALITHRRLRKKKQTELKKKLDKLPPVPKY